MTLRTMLRFAAFVSFCTAMLLGQPKGAAPTMGLPTTFAPNTSGMYLAGKFTVDGGGVPPDRVRVELICNSLPRPQGWSDDKGNFNVQLGIANPDETSDLSYANPIQGAGSGAISTTAPSSVDAIPKDMTGCELRGVLPGYRSSVVQLTAHRRLDSSDVGTIVLHRLSNVEGSTGSEEHTS